MTLRVRHFADRDYPAFVRIRRLAEQRDISVPSAREDDDPWDHGRYAVVALNTALGHAIVASWGYVLAIR